ncbi:MAG: hypothetical protein J5621_03790 [Paludibacteraceae bacterium]|nr:hypothetical protein [Paludibacteraceae bacterium]
MKKHILIGLLALAGVVMTACQDQVKQVAGTYSYKISGSAIVTGTNLLGEEEKDTVTLSDEMGAMELIRLDSTTAIVTFNAMNGPAYTTQAEIHGQSLTLAEYERDITIRTQDHHISASGEGTFYENTLIISLNYYSDEVKAENLTMLCKKN